MMDTIPTSVIECALLDGAPPQLGEGLEWCDAHNKCEGCAVDVLDVARDELRHLKAERDRALAELDKALGERDESDGWVKLPVDADGVTIHVGERVQLIGNDPSTVSHMSLADDGWRVYVKYDGGIGTGSGEPKLIHHHHAPTVEDVLEELLREYERDDSELTDGEIIERFAAKLRLAGDAE